MEDVVLDVKSLDHLVDQALADMFDTNREQSLRRPSLESNLSAPFV